ncbi:MAG: translocation/assembly module TamB domain-containing protein [Deltaproteobacteria bacterium]|nr:translocation/assembly module TamB domain-containing protein [Deltaproteobacteria bacterium]
MASPRRLWVRILRIFGIVVLSLLGLIVVAFFVAHTPPVDRWLRDMLVEKLGERMRGDVALESLDWGLNDGVTLEGLRIDDAQGRPAVVIDHVRVRPMWVSLLADQPCIADVEVRGGSLAVHIDREGQVNLARLSREPMKLPSGGLVIESIEVSGFEVRVEREGSAGVDVRDLDLWARAELRGGDGGGQGRLHELSGRMRVEPPGEPGPGPGPPWMELALSTLDLDASRVGASASLESARLGPALLWDVSAERRPGLGAPWVSLRLPGAIVDMEQLARVVGRSLGSGALTLAAALTGPEDALDLDARVARHDAELVARGRFDLLSRRAPRWALALDLAPGDLQGLMGPAAPEVLLGLDVLAAGEGVQPDTARGDLALLLAPLEVPAPLGLGSLGPLTARASWTPEQVRLVRAEAQVRGQVVGAEGSLERGSRELTAKLSTEGPLPLGLLADAQPGGPGGVAPRLRVEEGSLSAAIRVNGQLGASWSAWAGQLEAHLAAQGATLAPPPQASGPDGETEAVPLADRVALDLTLTKERAQPVAGGLSVDAEGLERGRARLDRLQLRVEASQAPGAARGTLPIEEATLAIETLRGSLGGVPVRLSQPARLVLAVDGPELRGTLEGARWQLGDGHLTVTAKALAAHHDFSAAPELTDLSVDLDLTRLPARALARLAGSGPPPVSGPLSGTLALRGFPARPEANVHMDGLLRVASGASAETPAVDWQLDGDLASQRLTIRSTAALRPRKGAQGAAPTGEREAGATKPPLVATVKVGLVVGEDLLPRLRAPLDVDLRLDETPVPDLLALAPGVGLPRALTSGTRLTAVLHLSGAPRAPTGELLLSVDGRRDTGAWGPQVWTLRGLVGLGAGETAVDLALATDAIPRLRLGGSVGVGTRQLVRGRMSAIERAPLELTLTVPDQPVPTPAPDAAGEEGRGLLQALGPLGRLSGEGTIRGSVTDPTLTARVAFDRLLQACGSRGKASLQVDADRRAGSLEVAVKALTSDGTEGDERLRITLGADWASVAGGGSEGGTGPAAVQRYGPLRWSVRTPSAGPIEVACAVPVALASGMELGVSGRFSSDLEGQLTVAHDGALWSVAELEGQGALRFVEGRLALGDTGRVLEDVAFEASIGEGAVRLDRFEAHETDLQRRDRSILASAKVAAAGEGFGKGSFELRTSKMLVMGPLDAPQAELDLALEGTMDLKPAINHVSVDISELELYAPARLMRFLWPVTVGTQDLIEQQGPDSQPPFRLPEPPEPPDSAPPPVARTAEAAEERREEDEADAAAAAEQPAGAARGWDVDIQFPEDFRIRQQGMSFEAHGSVHAELRPSGIQATSELVVDQGQMDMLNHTFDLVHGSISFLDGGRPWLDMTFWRLMPETVQRELAADGSAFGHAILRVATSPGMDRLPQISGAPVPYMLNLMALLHVDDVPRRSGPDLATSQSPQLPTDIQPLILSRMSMGFPDLLFLDHVIAWSDPLDDFDRYGEVRHLVGTRYLSGGHGRVGLFGRPETAGMNRRGIHADWLWAHTPRHTSGLGLRVGSELRAGLTVFHEWASEN